MVGVSVVVSFSLSVVFSVSDVVSASDVVAASAVVLTVGPVSAFFSLPDLSGFLSASKAISTSAVIRETTKNIMVIFSFFFIFHIIKRRYIHVKQPKVTYTGINEKNENVQKNYL